MNRKIILAPALLFGVAALLLTTSTASAHPIIVHPHRPIIVRPIVTVPAPIVVAPVVVQAQFRVIYRPTCNDVWQTYNVYNSQAYATDVVVDLQRQRFEAQVVVN